MDISIWVSLDLVTIYMFIKDILSDKGISDQFFSSEFIIQISSINYFSDINLINFCVFKSF